MPFSQGLEGAQVTVGRELLWGFRGVLLKGAVPQGWPSAPLTPEAD